MGVTFVELRKMVPGDRLFAPMNDFLIILAAIAHATSLMTNGKTHQTEQPTMRANASQYDFAFVLPLRGPLEQVLAKTVPAFIEIGTTKDPEPPASPTMRHMGLQQIIIHVTSPIFIFFFERYNEWLYDNFGDGENWHPTLNFCRVIRNAAAHGSVHFRNPRAKQVTWRGISLGPADNGRPVIGEHILPGDIIGLMFEADAELTAMGAPIL